MAAIKLIIEETITGGESLSDEKWCSFSDEYIDFKIKEAIYLPNYNDDDNLDRDAKIFHVDWEPYNSQDITVVVVRYSDGNTFGHIEGCYDIIEVCKTKAEANIAKNDIILNSSKYSGYFQTFDDVEFYDLTIDVEE